MKIDPEKLPLTIGAWVNLETKSSTNTIFGNRPYSGLKAISFDVKSGTPTIDFGVSSATDISFSDSKLTLNTWTHLALVTDTTAMEFRLYVNGVLSETETITDAHLAALDAVVYTGDAGHPCIGSKYIWTESTLKNPFIGQIASFSAYSDVRTAGLSRLEQRSYL